MKNRRDQARGMAVPWIDLLVCDGLDSTDRQGEL
jgi:hypothetical protein